MSIGDINSQERGSGARYNDGKPAMELLDMSLLMNYFRAPTWGNETDDAFVEWGYFFEHLSKWQRGGSTDDLANALVSITIITNEHSDMWLFTETARVLEYGRKKYAAWNWAKGMAWSIPLACIVRHAMALIEHDELDPESGLHHAGHIGANLMMLITFDRSYPEGDDRPYHLRRRDPTIAKLLPITGEPE